MSIGRLSTFALMNECLRAKRASISKHEFYFTKASRVGGIWKTTLLPVALIRAATRLLSRK